MWKRTGWGLVICCMMLVTVAVSQEKVATKSNRRLPNGYTKIGLLPAQSEVIYGIQDKYALQIDPLIAQVEALRKQRDAEIEKSLTEAQRTELARMRSEAAAAKTKKAAAAKKPVTASE